MTTTGVTGTTEVQRYLQQLRAELVDLPSGEVEDILGDVGVQLAESADELGRLGTPESYAAELRVAAGYAPAVRTAAPRLPSGRLGVALLGVACALAVLVGGVAALDGGLGYWAWVVVLLVALPAGLGWLVAREHRGLRGLPEVVALRAWADRAGGALPGGARELLAALRPAWWLLRAGLVALLLVGTDADRSDALALLVLTAVLALASGWLGLRTPHRRWASWTTLPLNAFCVGIGLGGVFLALTAVDDGGGSGYGYAEPVSDFASLPAYNVYPFDADGQPLTGVYLFDQDGEPIRLYANPCYDGSFEYTSGQDLGSTAFPLPEVVNDPVTGRCVVQPGVPFGAVAIPTPPTTSPAVPTTPSSVPATSSSVPATPSSVPATPATPTPPPPG